MNIEHLVTMANDIAAFFLSEAGEMDAPKEVASHITRFWDPRMRAQIIAHDHAGGEGLAPSAKAAVELLVPPGLRPT
jgi:formate dehydrogenase subunit delta